MERSVSDKDAIAYRLMLPINHQSNKVSMLCSSCWLKAKILFFFALLTILHQMLCCGICKNGICIYFAWFI